VNLRTNPMLIELDPKTFRHFFPADPHPFVSGPFITLNQKKADRIIHLAEDTRKPAMGLAAGIKKGLILSPFSAPFGGFHFKNENMYTGEIDGFLVQLKDYMVTEGLQGMELTLPPDLYHQTFNAKMVNALIRGGFQSELPDITGWIELDRFEGSFSHKNSREYYRQAVRNGLIFKTVTDRDEQNEVYELIRENRARFGRPIYMTFDDIIHTSELWTTDFFQVTSADHHMVASGIFYRSHPEIIHALFWGDNEAGRPLRAMDFLAFNIWSYYKDLGFKYIDLGISTESGIPNEGLLRFKESHNGTSSLKYKFNWYNRDVQN
jgi:hypothetical protein